MASYGTSMPQSRRRPQHHSRPMRSKSPEHVCPLLPESGQVADRLGMSASCQKATFAAQQNYCSITSSDTGINVRATSWA